MNSLSNLTLVNTALTAAGTAYLHLGGVLAVPANAEDGVYTGTMTVSLTF